MTPPTTPEAERPDFQLLDFELLFGASPDILLVLLPDAPRYTMVAATRARFAATHTAAETLGRGLFDLFPDNPDDPGASGAANLRASLERVLATRAPDAMAVQKYDIRGADGTFQSKYWSPKNVPVLGPGGEVRYILHRVEDVTELVRAGEEGNLLRGRSQEMEREVVARSRELSAAIGELREANRKLGELDRAKTAFFSNVSHEFRTPLTLMLGPLEDALAAADDPLGPRQRERIALAHDNALRLLKLVNALLDFSRLEAGRLSACFAPLDAAVFTAELAQMFRSALDRAGLELVVDCPPLSAPVWVDREMWEKIVSNLISNAFKFTHQGTVTVRARERRDDLLVEVADTGVGIPEAELPRLFERFHRVAETRGRAHEGSGIGLSLVKELVQLHGGTVAVASEVGKGSTFSVAIPKGHVHLPEDSVSQQLAEPGHGLVAAAHATEAGRWGSAATSAPTETKSGARVLIVDDSADLRAYMTGLLEGEYEVATVADGAAAMEAIRRRPPDLVLSDVMMPVLDGVGLLRMLRAEPATESLPVILLSARAGEEAAVEGLAAGADDYILKPFSARELLARVRTHVQLARARRAFTDKLTRVNRELDSFSYSVSHDLRAPLRAIDGFSQALAEDCGEILDEKGRSYLQRIRAGAKKMGELIEDLLPLARVSRVELHTGPVDLSLLAQEVVADLRAAEPSRKVVVEIAPGLRVEGDRALVKVVLVNLIGNAWKFTSRTEGARIDVGRAPGPSAFFVRDNGAGFDMKFADRLFAPFQRLHAQTEFEGTGVGLATVRRIAERHDGRVWVESASGKGACFFLELPVAAQTPPNG